MTPLFKRKYSAAVLITLGLFAALFSCTMRRPRPNEEDPKIIPLNHIPSAETLATFEGKDMVSEDDINQAFVFKTESIQIRVGGYAEAVSGGLTKLEILKVIKTHLPALGVCYKLETDYHDQQKTCQIDATFTIDFEGKTSVNGVTNENKCSDQFMVCVETELGKMKFPRPRGGNPVEVKYPFLFKPI